MKLSYSTLACPDWHIDKIIKYGKMCGYDGIELRGKEPHISSEFNPKERNEIKEIFKDNNLEVPCLTAYTRFDFRNPEIRNKNIKQLKKMIELAGDIGATYVRTFGGNMHGETDVDDVIPWVAEAFAVVDEVAKKHRVKVLIEVHDIFSKGKDVAKIFGRTSAKNCGVLWDVAHSIRAGEDIETTFNYLKDYIYHIHIKDWIDLPDKEEDHYVLLGAGKFPIVNLLKLLNKQNYNGYLSLEWEKAWCPEIEESEIAIQQFIMKIKQLNQEANYE